MNAVKSNGLENFQSTSKAGQSIAAKTSRNPTTSQNINNDMWKQIELTVIANLDNFEEARRFCAYCGNSASAETLGRCYGCQMVYYCSQEHQLNDWLEHMQKCSELEWVSLCELITSIPAPPPICDLGQYWTKSVVDVNSWTDWFDTRPNLINIARNTAKIFDHLKNLNIKKREPSFDELVDGLLAAITESMTYSLTIGNALAKVGVNPCVKSVCIHCLQPPTDVFDFKSNEEFIKRQFYELCNMFPGCKGFEIVFIGTNITSYASNEPYMKNDKKFLPHNQLLYMSTWHGTYNNYIKYYCQIENYSLPDLVVAFHPNFTSSPHKLIHDWTDDLKQILTNNFTCLFTFNDANEKTKAFNLLNAFQTNIICTQTNQFSSLLMRQTPRKPNQVYAANSYYMLIRGFNQDKLQQDDRFSAAGNRFVKQNACVQTIGLNQPENCSLRHVNGKLQILTNNRKSGNDDEIANGVPDHQANNMKSLNGLYRPRNFHRNEHATANKRINNNTDVHVSRYLNSGYATPSSETSGSYYQPRMPTLPSVSNSHTATSTTATTASTGQVRVFSMKKSSDSDNDDVFNGNKHPITKHAISKHQMTTKQSNSVLTSSKSQPAVTNTAKKHKRTHMRVNIEETNEDNDDAVLIEQLNNATTLPSPKPRVHSSMRAFDFDFTDRDLIEANVPYAKPRKPRPKPRYPSTAMMAPAANDAIMPTKNEFIRQRTANAVTPSPVVYQTTKKIDQNDRYSNPDHYCTTTTKIQANESEQVTRIFSATVDTTRAYRDEAIPDWNSANKPMSSTVNDPINTQSKYEKMDRTLSTAKQIGQSIPMENKTDDPKVPLATTIPCMSTSSNPTGYVSQMKNIFEQQMNLRKSPYQQVHQTTLTRATTNDLVLPQQTTYNNNNNNEILPVKKANNTIECAEQKPKTVKNDGSVLPDVSSFKNHETMTSNDLVDNATPNKTIVEPLQEPVSKTIVNTVDKTTVPSTTATVPPITTTVSSTTATVPSTITTGPSITTTIPSIRTTVLSLKNTVPSTTTILPSFTTTVSSTSTTCPPATTSMPSTGTAVPSTKVTSLSTTTNVTFSSTNMQPIRPTGPSITTTVPSTNSAIIDFDSDTVSTSTPLSSDFRIFSKKDYDRRSICSSSAKSVSSLTTNTNSVFIKHVSDSVEVVNLEFEGERRVLVPGYMTSADILRNMLIKERKTSTGSSDASSSTGSSSLREKLRMQLQADSNKATKTKQQQQQQAINNSDYSYIDTTAREPINMSQTSGYPSFPVTEPPVLPLSNMDSKTVNCDNMVATSAAQVQSTNTNDDDDFYFLNKKPTSATSSKKSCGVLKLDNNNISSENKSQVKHRINLDLIDCFDLASGSSANNSKMDAVPLGLVFTQKKDKSKDQLNFNVDDFRFIDNGNPIGAISNQQRTEDNSIQKATVDPFHKLVPSNELKNQNESVKDIDQQQWQASGPVPITTSETNHGSNLVTKADNQQRQKYLPETSQTQGQMTMSNGIGEPETYSEFYSTTVNHQKKATTNEQLGLPVGTVGMQRPNTLGLTTDMKPHVQTGIIKQQADIVSLPDLKNDSYVDNNMTSSKQRKESVVGNFDANDFDSFDEGDFSYTAGRMTNADNQVNPYDYTPIQINKYQHEQSTLTVNVNQPTSPVLTTFLSPKKEFKQLDKSHPAYMQARPVDIKLSRFDPNDFDSFDEDDRSGKVAKHVQRHVTTTSTPTTVDPMVSARDESSKSGGFFRTALNRISGRSTNDKHAKKRSSSMPPAKILDELRAEEMATTPGVNANPKTLKIMNKMQIEFEEKQKRRQMKQQKPNGINQADSGAQQQLKPNDRSFFNNFMNSLFSNTAGLNNKPTDPLDPNDDMHNFQKNEIKRLSLRKIKAKDKAKKNPDTCGQATNGDFYQSDSEIDPRRYSSYSDTNVTPSQDDSSSYTRSASFDTSSIKSIPKRFGQIKNENNSSNAMTTNKEDIMQQIKADLDEEIKSRFAVENANHKSQMTQHRSCQQLHQSDHHVQKQEQQQMFAGGKRTDSTNAASKMRSKSVTFLDAISTADNGLGTVAYLESTSNRGSYYEKRDNQPTSSTVPFQMTTPNANRKSLRTGDVRLMCGALTGAGPIRSIIKKSATDLSITLNAQLSTLSHMENDKQRTISNNDDSSDDCTRNRKRQSDL